MLKISYDVVFERTNTEYISSDCSCHSTSIDIPAKEVIHTAETYDACEEWLIKISEASDTLRAAEQKLYNFGEMYRRSGKNKKMPEIDPQEMINHQAEYEAARQEHYKDFGYVQLFHGISYEIVKKYEHLNY